MSMPEFPDGKNILSQDQAINAILTSIAMEETALSHIINAESEKIQLAIEHIKCNNCCDLQKLLEVNESAASLIEQVNDMQIILKNKLRCVVRLLPPPCPPPLPCPPICEPCCPCVSAFSDVTPCTCRKIVAKHRRKTNK